MSHDTFYLYVPFTAVGGRASVTMPNGTQTAYACDDNGSLTNSAPSTGLATAYSYDLENRLATATVNRLEGANTVNVVASYVYNPFGIRARADTTTTINGGTPMAKKKAFVMDAHPDRRPRRPLPNQTHLSCVVVGRVPSRGAGC